MLARRTRSDLPNRWPPEDAPIHVENFYLRRCNQSLHFLRLVLTMSIMLASFQLHDHAPHLPQGPPGSGPPVSFARSGITAAWDPKFKSLLELAEARDVPVRWSCQTGVCHTCMTGLIDGPITYNPELPEMASSALLEPMPTKAIIAAWKGRARIRCRPGRYGAWRSILPEPRATISSTLGKSLPCRAK